MGCFVEVLPGNHRIAAEEGSNLLQVLRGAGLAPDAPCGGEGRCGKCKVICNGKEVLACRVAVTGDMTVILPREEKAQYLPQAVTEGCSTEALGLAVDIGTTTVAGSLVESASGRVLAALSAPNPQSAYGADVVTRLRCAMDGHGKTMTEMIRRCVEEMADALCSRAKADPGSIRVVSIVGNPAMQQLYLGLPVENLVKLPFAPVLTTAEEVDAAPYLPGLPGAKLLAVPDISAYVGADTVGCLLAVPMEEETSLLVDIGTNGEMVLHHGGRMVACSAAAGPALEGANIQFGMRAKTGAIDRVRLEDGKLTCHVVGGGEAVGICGSGLIDAVAAALDAGWIDARGNILREDKRLPLTDGVFLTQEDIRQVQLAKGAIAAGIGLMAEHLGIGLGDIQKVWLAGAFGSFLDPEAACRIGLLPRELSGRIGSIGNAALEGARLLAGGMLPLEAAQRAASRTEPLELGSLPGFPKSFAKNMRF